MPPEEQQKYVGSHIQDGPVGVPGAGPGDAGKPKSKAAIKNEKKKLAAARAKEEARQQKPEEVDKVAELAAAMGVTSMVAGAPPVVGPPPATAPTPPPPVPEAAVLAAAPVAAPDAALAGAPAPEGVSTEVEKKVRALKKKLRGVDDLIAKQAAGTELNADQLSKVSARGELEAEITRWEAFSDLEEISKEVKKLGKKLRQIEELEERATKGEALNADQQGKIAQKDKIVSEHAKLGELLSSTK